MTVKKTKGVKTRKKKTTRKSKGDKLMETQESTALATPSDWAMPDVTSQDIVIPRILAMQGLSEMVTDGKAKFGEFRESLNGTLIGSIDEPFEFIPFYLDKKWIVQKSVAGKWEYSHTTPVTPSNESHPFESAGENGVQEKWTRVFDFYCLLPAEVEQNASLPYIVSFRGTSFRAGRKLLTQMYVTNRAAKKAPAAQVMELHGRKEQNDLGTFVVMDVKTSREAEAKEVKAAYDWMKTVQTGAAKTDSDEVPF